MASRPGSPSWLSEPCPDWCARNHHEDDHPEDRYHQSEPSIFPAVAGTGDSVPLTASLEATVLGVRMGQHVDSHEPWVLIESLDAREPRILLATESATALSRHLDAQLQRGEH